MKKILSFLFLLTGFCSFGQSTDFYTTFPSGSFTSGAMVHLPSDYFSRTDSVQAIIFFTGSGEVGVDTSKIKTWGPLSYLRGGWDGGVQLANGKYYPIIISIQLPATYKRPWDIKVLLDNIKAAYRIKTVNLTGLSMGGWEVGIFASYQPSAGDHTYQNYIKSFVALSPVTPSDTYDATPAYPDRFGDFSTVGGTAFLTNQDVSDVSNVSNIATFMNGVVSGSGVFEFTHNGAGTHCCWDYEYGSATRVPRTHIINGVTENIYQFMIRSGGDTSLSTPNGQFSFTLASTQRTSAGVFKTDSTLVRTLWADSTFAPGTYTKYWDGKDDNGNTITSPDANYVIKVLKSNVIYNWDGIIGNTSLSKTGQGVHRGTYTSMIGMAITGTTAYFCQGYSEGYPSEAKFNTSNPQVRLNPFPGNATMNSEFVATDGTNVYWAGYDGFVQSVSFVHASKVSDDSQFSFGTNGVAYAVTYGRTYTSVIDTVKSNSHVTGLAVQTSGNYLFVSHKKLNKLKVFNKTTGALIQSLTFTKPEALAVEGSSLWMVTDSNVVAKYTVNSDGTLTAATLTLSGVNTAGAIAVSGGNIAVIDAGVQQIVRFYNTSTGTAGTSLGTVGGYATSPVVSNSKFMFDNYVLSGKSYLAFQPDGSFWVGDGGNYRNQHYSAAKTFIETVMSMGATYTIAVDPNNINRVFGNYLEFNVDYTPLSGSTGWTLVKNWGYTAAAANGTLYKLINIVTLSNGRTYCFNYYQGFGELSSTGFRYIPASGFGGVLCKDGSLQKTTGRQDSGSNLIITRYPLTGFDGSNNPIWSSTGTVIATTPTNNEQNPNTTPVTDVQTYHNKVVFYTTTIQFLGNINKPQNGYHLGAIKVGTNTWRWKTMNATHRAYTGNFPEADRFDRGNNVNDYAGSQVNVIDSNIIAGYHGEFWKNGETNYYNHFLDDGLPVGQFGTDGSRSSPFSDSGNAGNALTIALVRNGNTLYLFHGDESQHSGVHRWSASNISSITEQYITIPFPSGYVAPVIYGYVNLHTGLPFNATLATQNGWSKTGSTVQYYSNRKKYINDGSPDVLYADVPPYTTTSGTASMQRDLGTNNVTTSWKITTTINFSGTLTIGNGNKIYIEVLDASDKVLARFYWVGTYAPFPTPVFSLYGNTARITNDVQAGPNEILSSQPLEISCAGGTVTFAYGTFAPVTAAIFDGTGNWRTPKTFRAYTIFGSPSSGAQVGLVDSKLYTDNSSAPNVPPVANAGADQAITPPTSSVTLAGSGTDADGTISSYAWSKVSGPAAGTITTPNSATTTVTSLSIAGTYIYKLTVTDNSGASASDNISIVLTASATRKVMGSGSGSIYFVNAGSVVPGDTICITAGTYDQISFDGLQGTAANPIVIEPCGGVVTVTNSSLYCYRVVNSRYIHFTGSRAGVTYGFVATQPNLAIHCGSGMNFRQNTSDYEIDHYDSYNCENGFLCKIDPDDSLLVSYSNGFTIANVNIHDCRVRKTQGEGFYIINTASTVVVKGFSGADTTVEPVKGLNISLHDNIVDSTGWDGIQLASTINAKIYNNTVTNYGLQNMGSQQGGILLGAKSTGSIRSNYIKGGTGNGIQLFSYSIDTIANNLVINTGIDGTANGQHGIFVDDRPDPSNQYRLLDAFIMNNTVINSGNYAIGIFNSNGTMDTRSKIYNNLLVQTGSKYYDLQGGVVTDRQNNITLSSTGAGNFVGGNDYHLLYNSPAVDAGLDLSYYNITKDLDGVTRAAPFEAGAYEFNGAVPPPPVVRRFVIIHGKVIYYQR